MCDEWKRDFTVFLRDMGPRPKGATLERRNNDLGYSPENCLWASRIHQARNKRNNHRLSFNGESFTLSEWSERLRLKRSVIQARLKLGWSIEKTLSTPRLTHWSRHLP